MKAIRILLQLACTALLLWFYMYTAMFGAGKDEWWMKLVFLTLMILVWLVPYLFIRQRKRSQAGKIPGKDPV